jgi:hypothetical protein
VRHWTQAFVVVSQTPPGPPAAALQFMSVVHWTHRIVVVLQTGLARVMHCALVMHVATHVFVAVLHAWPMAQSEFITHPTHV